MIARAPRAPRHRTRLPNTFQPQLPAITWTAAINAGNARVTTNLPTVINGLPTTFTVQGVAPLTITQISPTVFDLHYTAAVVATNVLLIPAGNPMVRGQTGGTLAAGSVTF